MNSRILLQPTKHLLFVPSVMLAVMATPTLVAADTIDIQNTNYSIPNGAYFVAPNGKDTNSGRNANSPWTVAKALSAAPSGATIVFRGGQYRNVQASITKRLTLQAYPNEKPWLKGSTIVTGWANEGRIWRKDGWNYSFPQNVGQQYIDSRYPLAGRRDMVYVNGAALKQVGSKAAVGAGEFYVDAANNKLYIGTNPSGKTVEATTKNQAFMIWKSRFSNPTDTVIRGLGFAHYADQGVKIGAPRLTLENNTFAWNGVYGAAIFSTDGIVRGNTFTYNGRQGLFGVSTHRTRIENNTINNNNVENFRKQWDAAGVKIIKTDGAIVRGNLVANNNSTGIWIDNSATNTTIVKNNVRNNKQNGILFEISHKAIIAANVVTHNYPVGVFVYNSSSARVYNNTIAQNNANIAVKDTQRNNRKSSEISKGITWIARNNIVKNNILWQSTGASLFFAPSCETRVASTQMVPVANFNAYYRRSLGSAASHTWSSGGSRCSVVYNSLTAFKNATGLESNGMETVASSDPFFVNASGGDYRLKSGSPAIRRGESLPTDIANAIGVAAGVAVDLGALQHNASFTQ